MERAENSVPTLNSGELIVSAGGVPNKLLVDRSGTVTGEDTSAMTCQVVEGDVIRVVSADGGTFQVIARRIKDDSNHAARFACTINGKKTIVTVDNRRSLLRSQLLSTESQSMELQSIAAPMPGLVTKIEVAVGDNLESGQGILILEAMKMENEIRSVGKGIVKKIFASLGKPVEKGELLVEIQPTT